MAGKLKRKDDENIVTLIASLRDGTHVVEHADGKLERRRSETDWKRFENITDEEIEQSITDDPDWEEFKDIDWSKAEVVVPANKVAISIRLDPDVVEFFKANGPGYQRRINAVLRTYVRQKRKADNPGKRRRRG
jgi:uncharacterized protein (DUF4415 family)